MSYRSDHDAAVARVETLESELHQRTAECDRLRGQLARPREPYVLEPAPIDSHFRRRRTHPMGAVVLYMLLIVALAVLSLAHPSHH
jgi:ferric-dicitrate binding protein FerR (iron transport regulator)